MNLPGLDRPDFCYSSATTVTIIGAGIGGCALASRLAKSGFNCVLYDKNIAPACETSAVPRALVRPQVTKKDQATTRYFLAAFDRIYREVQSANTSQTSVTAQLDAQLGGALQLVKNASAWPDSITYEKLTKTQASQAAEAELASDALYFQSAGWLNMKQLCHHWINVNVRSKQIAFIGNTPIEALRRSAHGWQLFDTNNRVITESPLVVISSAEAASQFSQTAHLPLQKSRGQISFFRVRGRNPAGIPSKVVTGKGSVIPADGGFWTGSTHQRNNESLQSSKLDDRQNFQSAIALCPEISQLFNQNSPEASQSWTGFRFSTPDRMPIIGAAPQDQWYRKHYADLRHGRQRQSFAPARFHKGLYLLTGFGSRGALHSVYAAELLANIITGRSPADDGFEQTFNRLTHPGRFIIRQLRRGLAS